MTKPDTTILDRNLGRHAPLYQVLRERLRHQILGGKLPGGSRIATEHELSAEHGVSIITVRRAMQELVNDGLLVRVAGKGTFVNASPFARTHNVLFVHRLEFSFEHPYTGLIFKGINEANLPTTRFRLETLGLPMPDGHQHADRKAVELVEHDQIHGVVAMPFLSRPVLEAILAQGVPVVTLNATTPLPAGVANIRFAPNEQAVERVIDHLQQRGRRRIGCVTARRLAPGEHPFGRLMAARGLPVDVSLAQSTPWGIRGGFDAANALLDRHPDLDAILTGDDIQALGVMHALWRRGLQPGREVAVTGMGHLLSDHDSVGLTTIDLSIRQGALQAAKLLLDLIDGQAQPHAVDIPWQLIVGQTS